MNIKTTILLFCFMGIAMSSRAEILVLKNGNTIEGKIIERTDKYIKVDILDIPITYYLADVDSIDGQKVITLQIENKIPVKEKVVLIKEEGSPLSFASDSKLSLGELKEAQECLQKGTGFFKEKKYKEATLEFEKALKINPKLAEGYYGLGYVYTSTKSYPEAINYFNKALEASPNYAEAYIGLAYISSILGDYEQAIDYYQKVLKIKKDNLEAYNGLGFSYASLGKNKEAIEYFKEVIKINSEYAPAYSGLGVLYFSLGQAQEAKENFLKAKAILEKNKDIEGVKAIEEYLSMDGRKTNASTSLISGLDNAIVAPESYLSTSSFTETFTNKKWGYSFNYPSTWEKIPKGELKEGIAMGIRPKEDSGVTIEIQRGDFPDSDIEGKENLRELMDEVFVATGNLKKESIESINLSGEPGYRVIYTLKKAVVIKGTSSLDGIKTIIAKHFFDSYFMSPVFSSKKQDKRFFHIKLHYLLYENPEDVVEGIKINREFTANFMGKNELVKKHLQEANEIINSFHVLEQ
ncbi:MAG: tetratricopeptide repeat protein [Candidatus Omnitrophota bacterium]|jgi:tetratricopeptide (TPR) repeat protein